MPAQIRRSLILFSAGFCLIVPFFEIRLNLTLPRTSRRKSGTASDYKENLASLPENLIRELLMKFFVEISLRIDFLRKKQHTFSFAIFFVLISAFLL
jgi:hypothetical protein